MSLAEEYSELLQEHGVRPSDAVIAMEAFGDLFDGLQKLARVEEDDAEEIVDISSRLGELLGFNVGDNRISTEEKERIQEKMIELSKELEEAMKGDASE